jgi:phosphohistidine phosphatase
MPKLLVIFRHGKSTWDYEGISDFDRPLKEVGIVNTQAVAQKLKEKGVVPMLILSSPANRALHTATIVARELYYPVEKIVIDSTLYGESESEILDLIKTTNDQYNSLFIFGHNPVFTELPNRFLKQPIDNLPTSGAAVLQFETSFWNEISKKILKEEYIFMPKSL